MRVAITRLRVALRVVVAALTLSVGGACAASAPAAPQAPPTAIVDGEGRPLGVDEVVRRMAAADVALIGEIHGHREGLALATRLFAAVADEARRAALSLEFLERDEQAHLDAYVAGAIDEEELARRRRGAPLAPGHRAMIDVARAHGLPVVAANAPRRHAKLARLEGWDALAALPAAERALFVVPSALPGGRYRARFADAMGADHAGGDAERIASFFRAQSLWDATMADSVARALAAGRAPVVHVAGRFHVEHDGGLVQMIRVARPAARVVRIVMSEAPSDEDRGSADAVAFVGPAPRSHP